MKKKQIIGLVVAAALFVGVSAASVFTNTISKNLLQNSADDIINLGGSYPVSYTHLTLPTILLV